MDLAEAKAKTETLSNELMARRPQITKRINYFKGKTGQLRFASPKFAEYFDKQYNGFSDNWCMPVAQAPAERMNLLGIRPYGRATGVDRDLERAWLANDADAGSSEAFLMFGVAARSYSLVSPASGPDGVPRITWEHPESAIVDTDPETGIDRAGLIVWADDKMDYATLYTAAEVFRFKRESSQNRYERQGTPADLTGGWALRNEDVEVEANPLGEVPLTELRNQTMLDDEPISDIDGVGALQDTANLIWAYLLNALDQASLPGRVVTGADLPKTPILDANGQIAGYADVELDELMKERILWLPGQNTKISEWTAAQLDVFSKVIEQIVEHIAAQTRTPPHYLVAKMVNTAAESLNIAEAGLVSKTGERIKYAGRGMRKTHRLLAKAMGANERRLVALNAGTLVWADVQYRSDSQMADAVGKLRSSGFPMEYIAERLVKDPSEVARIMKMIDREKLNDPLLAAQRAMQTGMPDGFAA